MSLQTSRFIKSYANLLSLVVGFLLVTIAYVLFLKSSYFSEFQTWAEGKEVILFTSLIIIKVLGIIWPPLPGGVITLGAIPVIGWELAYTSDLLGTTLGCSLAFSLSRHYGKGFLRKLFSDGVIEQIESLRFRRQRQFEMFLVLMVAGSTVVDIIAYAAGLIKSVNFSSFILARLLSHLIIGIPSFILVGKIVAGQNVIVNVALILLLIPIIWKLRHRYLEL